MGQFIRSFLALALLLRGSAAKSPELVSRTWQGQEYGCRCYSDDGCWPKEKDWAKLNSTVDGNLILHIPPEAVCHQTFEGPLGTIQTYDEAACDDVRANYSDEQWTVEQDASLIWKYYTNYTCQPSEDPSTPCTLGYHGVYVLDAHNKDHIKAGVDFARENNVRLILRNTGHDFIGRSTGWGGLVIRTHELQDFEFLDSYDGPGDYQGKAITIAAGIQARSILTKAHELEQPQMMLTGECPTVGIAGGLVQGGGHGPWTTLKGMTADNALSFDVVTAKGEFLTANESENPDLFWALKGGGPLTYAIVLSVTLKTWDDLPSSGGTLFINFTQTTDPDTFWEGVRLFHEHSNHFVDNGLYAYFELGALILRVVPFVAINQTKAQLDAITAPLLSALDNGSIPYEYTSKEYPTFFDLYTELFEDEPAGGYSLTGGWMFSHQDVEENNDGIVDAFKTVVSPREDLANAGFMIGHLFYAGYNMPQANSATHPRFRNSTNFIISTLNLPTNATLAVKADMQDVLTNTMDEALREAGPHGCTYVNEADPYQPNWQERFWGENYPELLDIKHEWDPEGLFWTIATPGSEEWEVIEYGTRLCKKL